MNYLEKLKEKCNLDDNFMNIVYQIFDKLYSFGYITKRQTKILQKRLYSNIDIVIFGNDSVVDYKAGYYDAIKKELYIKDMNELESIYLRILYAITTTEVSKDSYTTGYSTSFISKENYKIIHEDFAINRAIISNLACRLLYTLPTTLELMPTYRTYENDFLGSKFLGQNDIYFLEGRILSQICYILNISEENFYINLFINPRKYLKKFFQKAKFKDSSTLLNLLDRISRNYSNYNKLVFFNKKLNENYLNIRKNDVRKQNTTKLLKEQEKIKMLIRRALEPMVKSDETQEEFEDIETSLSEKIAELEESIKTNIIKIQNLLVYTLFDNELRFSNVDYAIKLKELNKLIVIPNKDIEEKIYEVISQRILNTFESTSTNIIEKVKYTLANEVLSSEKYAKIYKSMGFRKLDSIKLKDANSMLVAVTIDDSFITFSKIYNLDYKIKELKNNSETYKINSFEYILNNPSASFDITYIEKIFAKIKTKFTEFLNLRAENMYICTIDEMDFVVIQTNNSFKIIQITKKENNNISCKLIKLSETYTIFSSNSNLPVLYKKSENPLKKLMSII